MHKDFDRREILMDWFDLPNVNLSNAFVSFLDFHEHLVH